MDAVRNRRNEYVTHKNDDGDCGGNNEKQQKEEDEVNLPLLKLSEYVKKICRYLIISFNP